MNPTQTNTFHHRWSHHPDLDYHFSHRFRWPAAPVEGASGAAANAAAEGAAGLGSGGGAQPPPRGPYGGYHHYYERGPYRRWGRRPSRFIWFGIGAITATVWYKHHHERKNDLEKFITDPQCWSRYPRTLPPPPTETPTASGTPAVPSPAPSATDSLPKRDSSWWRDDEKRHAGWRAWKEQKMEEHRARHEAKAVQAQAPVDTTSSATSGETAEFKSLREAVEKLWAEKTAADGNAQKVNDQAREYASEKLEKLSVALENLRESLKVDDKPQGVKKLV
ncbi:hypothetical protein B9479_001763 [Cryptococcus floricola]|uniref:Uncharacterized protein n=1 Tax=Cryptococcus floricola TaxID=2591691 RepID=A0A5D3B573_9TREE|nr:hypothetical protein B9479_001763 [Cryptococcus floricola]